MKNEKGIYYPSRRGGGCRFNPGIRAESEKGSGIMDLLNTAVQGVIIGAFSGGAVWGVLKMEMKFLRRDLDEVRIYLWGDRRNGNQKT